MFSPLAVVLLTFVVLCSSQSDEDVFRKVSVAFRSYAGDINLAPEAIESAMKYIPLAKSFTLVVPEKDWELFGRKFNDSYPNIVIDPRFSLIPEKRLLKDDRMQQKLSKMLADTYCRGKFILHVDSDMIFRRQLLASDVMFEGKPMLFFQDVKNLPVVVAWPQGTSTALGRETPYEFSRTALKLFPRTLYAAARNHLVRQQGKSIEAFLDDRIALHNTSDGPRLFSDFNYMGAYGFYFMREQFALNPLDEDLRVKVPPSELPPHPLYDICCQGNGQAASFTESVPETVALLRNTWRHGHTCADVDVLAGLFHRVPSKWFDMHKFVCEEKLFGENVQEALPCDRFPAIRLVIPLYHKWAGDGVEGWAPWSLGDGSGSVQCFPIPSSFDIQLTHPVLMEIPKKSGSLISVHRTHVKCSVNGHLKKVYALPSTANVPTWKFGGEFTIYGGLK